MKDTDRAAANELIQLMATLGELKSLQMRAVAAMIAARLLAIAERGAGEPASEASVEVWIQTAREMIDVVMTARAN